MMANNMIVSKVLAKIGPPNFVKLKFNKNTNKKAREGKMF